MCHSYTQDYSETDNVATVVYPIPSSDDAAGSSLAEDALQCLQAMAATPLGLQRMWRSGTPDALAKGGTREGPGTGVQTI